MDLRRSLLANAWLQLLLVGVIVVLANTWAARSFFRLDLTRDKVYSLDLATRALMYRLEKPLVAKVYFTKGLQAPYNNHEQVVVDTLDEMRAYSRGLMEVEVTDPTHIKELEDEAKRFGIQPIQYRYRSANVAEMKKVYMGVALVYGDKQQVLPAITDLGSLEYELAKAVKALVSDSGPKTVGYTQGHGEPDLATAKGPLETLRTELSDNYKLVPVPLGGPGPIPDSIDALLLIGPTRPMGDRALYQLDQYLMRGGPLAMFISSFRPELRTMRPQRIYHGLDRILGAYGVQLNRDVVVDRKRNGVMRFPVRRGRYVVQMPVNYPLIPRATKLDKDSVIVEGLDSMLFPFASSITLADPLPPEVEGKVLAASSDSSGRIKDIRTIDPSAYKLVAPGEERGSWPLLVQLSGAFPSAFANKPIPPAEVDPATGEPYHGPPDDPASKLGEGASTRLVVAGSADFVANNLPFVLNLVDWMLQDESLIRIRSKTVQMPSLEPMDTAEARLVKGGLVLGGPVLLVLVGLVRWLLRRRTGGAPVTPPLQVEPDPREDAA